MKHYLVDWHKGGYSWEDEDVNIYCETCGDSDYTILVYDDDDDDEPYSIIELFIELVDWVYDSELALWLIHDLGEDELLVRQIERCFEEIGYKRSKEE